MSKKDGTLFSSALFGYKKSDVNEYIRLADISHSDQLLLLQAENERLLERAKNAEARIEELENTINLMEIDSQTRIDGLKREFEAELKQAKEAAAAADSKGAKKSRKLFGLFGSNKK